MRTEAEKYLFRADNVWESMGMFVVYRSLLKMVGFKPGSVEVC